MSRLAVALFAAVSARAGISFTVDALTHDLTSAWTFSGAYSTVPGPVGDGCPSIFGVQQYAVALYPGAEASLTVDGGIPWIQYGMNNDGLLATVSFYVAGQVVEQHDVNSTAYSVGCEEQESSGWNSAATSTTVKVAVHDTAASAALDEQPQFVLTAALVTIEDPSRAPPTTTLGDAGSSTTATQSTIGSSAPLPAADQTTSPSAAVAKGGHVNEGLIIGAALGGVLVLLLAGTAVLWRCKRRRPSQRVALDAESTVVPNDAAANITNSVFVERSSSRRMVMSEGSESLLPGSTRDTWATTVSPMRPLSDARTSSAAEWDRHDLYVVNVHEQDADGPPEYTTVMGHDAGGPSSAKKHPDRT